MGQQLELVRLLESIAGTCKRQTATQKLDADKVLLGSAANQLMRIVFHLEHHMMIPTIRVFGPAITLIQQELGTHGYERSMSDFVVYDAVAYYGNVYPLIQNLQYATFERPLVADEEKYMPLGIFSEKFDPKRLRV